MNLSWYFKMALRDSRRNRGRLLLFMSSIVIGIAALVAINSFGYNLRSQIDNEAKELLGADLELSSRTPIEDDIRQVLDSLDFKLAEEVSFASMVLFPNEGTRLVNIRAVEGEFPFYEEMITEPADARTDLTQGRYALADKTLLLQFDASAGDSLKIGDLTYYIAGAVLEVPGQSAITTTVAPPVFIPLETLSQTGLVQLGSRMNYKIYAKYPAGFDQRVFEDYLSPLLEKTDLRFDDVAERKEDLGDAYADLTGFLNLTAFVALILGCIGVAGSVHIYLKEKVLSVAILRCMGASGRAAMNIYMVQVGVMGFLGSVFGAIAGALLQVLLPSLFSDFLPLEVEITLSWAAIFQGIAIGFIASLLFSLLSLMRLRRISPLRAIRASFGQAEKTRAQYAVYAFILIFILAFSYVQLDSFIGSLVFTAGLLLSFGLLAGFAELVVRALRKYFPSGLSFVVRQSLANLFRPNNQTTILVVTIGLGTALIATLLISQDLLVSKVTRSSAAESRPNMVLFDIQTGQLEAVKSLTKNAGLPVLNEVPIVTMRLHSIDGRSVDELKADTASGVRDWILRREYRVSYRDSLTDAEEIIAGEFQSRVESERDSIFISLEQGLMEDMKVELGDEVVFNVQGALIKTYVGSFRKIDWQRIQTNFLVLFPEGVLEKAPKFHVILTRFGSSEESAAFQSQVVKAFPNISIIDLELVLNTVDAVLGKVSFVIRFMAFFSIFTGILVLIGSVLISKYQRVQESVLLRTLGAKSRQVYVINALEYFLLGSLAALSGILIALVAGTLLARLSFDTELNPNWMFLVAVYLIIVGITVLIGLSNTREVVRRSPLEILRS